MGKDNIKILAVGDLHLRMKAPEMRIDDYYAEVQRKLQFILDTAHDRGADLIIFPGDIFDRHDAPHGLVEWAIRAFKDLDGTGIQCLFIYGQHDLRYHTSDKQNSPLGVLVAGLGEMATVLSSNEEGLFEYACHGVEVFIVGCSWGEEIPEEIGYDTAGKRAKPCKATRILVLHRLIMREKAFWAEDEEKVLTTKQLFKTCNADVFICGDNHEKFVVSARGRHIINMGSVLRSTTKQVDHEPALGFLEISAENGVEFEEIPIPIEHGVFDMEVVEEKQAQTERIAAFVEGLQQEFDAELSFKENMRLAAKDAPKGVQSILEECLE